MEEYGKIMSSLDAANTNNSKGSVVVDDITRKKFMKMLWLLIMNNRNEVVNLLTNTGITISNTTTDSQLFDMVMKPLSEQNMAFSESLATLIRAYEAENPQYKQQWKKR